MSGRCFCFPETMLQQMHMQLYLLLLLLPIQCIDRCSTDRLEPEAAIVTSPTPFLYLIFLNKSSAPKSPPFKSVPKALNSGIDGGGGPLGTFASLFSFSSAMEASG